MKANLPIIEMSGVACGALRDSEALVVGGADWRVAAGDFWCVAGAGGAGKSDFLMLAAGLLTPARGSLKLFGAELPDAEDGQLRQRLKIGFVFDGGHLFNHLTVAENIALPLRYHLEPAADELAGRVGALLEFAELTPWANSTPGTLGRNWIKRAGLARALALQPEVLLLDNPLGGTDARHTAWWLDAVAQLAAGHATMPGRRATTVVLTADDPQPWRGVARQFARLHNGRLETEI